MPIRPERCRSSIGGAFDALAVARKVQSWQGREWFYSHRVAGAGTSVIPTTSVALIALNATLTLVNRYDIAMVIVIPMTLEVADVPNADELRNVVSR